jgi:parallel beta-helix repeat protein
MKGFVLRFIPLLILCSVLISLPQINMVKASGTIYIRADGSIEGTIDISTVENVTYTFTDNIFNQSIIVERDNIVVDGAGHTIQGTEVDTIPGVDLSHRSNVTIKNMEIRVFGIGIKLSNSSRNSISGNNITNNLFGIYLWESPNNTLRNNDASNNKYHFGVYGSLLSQFIQDIDDSNTVDDKPVYYWVSRRNIAVPLDAGYVALVNCTGITVKNLNLTNNGQGVLLAFTTNSTITKNNITNNVDGICLYYCSNNTVRDNGIVNNDWNGILMSLSSNYNTISGNNITANSSGIDLSNSSNYNVISGNDVIANKHVSIWLRYSSNNSIYGNNITNNENGVWLRYSLNNSIFGNDIVANNWYGIWLDESSNYNSVSENHIENNLLGIVFWYSSSNNVFENNITTNNREGIWVDWSSNNTINGNNITNNLVGVELEYSPNNTISGNNITNNSLGIQILDSHSNTFYHNNLDNINQVKITTHFPSYVNFWNDNCPSGGNYWSDYEERYPNATEIDGSGMWDTPYVIDENNQDNCPLIHLYGSIRNLDTNLTYLTIQSAMDAHETLDGQTILVHAGAYYEHVFINKSISLIGENRSTTVIDGNGTGNVVTIYSDFVTVSGFTIQNSGFFLGLPSGIEMGSANCTISNCDITSNKGGIALLFGGNHTIINNTISSNYYGIYIVYSENNKIFHNYFLNNTNQTYSTGAINTWDSGYPSGGNYWSDYEDRYPDAEEINESGIWDTPYVIYSTTAPQQDNYPLVPEFPTWTSMLLILIVITVVLTAYKRKLFRIPIDAHGRK